MILRERRLVFTTLLGTEQREPLCVARSLMFIAFSFIIGNKKSGLITRMCDCLSNVLILNITKYLDMIELQLIFSYNYKANKLYSSVFLIIFSIAIQSATNTINKYCPDK